MPPTSSKKRAICAIDFGTARTGFAYKSQEQDLKISPVVHTHWGVRTESKTATYVIVKARDDGGGVRSASSSSDPKHPLTDIELVDYGFNAEQRKVQDNQEAYRGFKMCLYAGDYYGKEVSSAVTEFATNGRPVCRSINNKTPTDCINVIAALLKEMKESAIVHLRDCGLEDITVSEILWILTVPAIWSPESKNWMRTAAIQAGLPESPDDTKMCLEPEAAALTCLHDPNLGLKENDVFIVLDAGGGTIDVVVFKMGPDKTMTQLKGYPASGGDWGSQYIDRNFDALLVEIFGEENMLLAKSNTQCYANMLESFNSAKCTYDGNTTQCQRVNLGNFVFIKGENSNWSFNFIRNRVAAFNERKNESISFEGGFINLPPSVMNSMFDPVITKTMNHMRDLIVKVNPKHVLVVGGFAMSPYLRRNLDSLKSQVNVYVPDRAGSAVLEGAVWYGMRPEAITGRVCRYTYGISTSRIFDSSEHDEDHAFVADGVKRCDGCFSIYVRRGDVVQTGDVVTKEFYPIYKDQRSVSFPIYSSTEMNPKYAHDSFSRRLGTVTVPLPKDGDKRDLELTASFSFGGPEILVTVLDEKTGNKRYINIAFNDIPENKAI